MLERALTTTPLDSRAFRAGVILNPLRGLTMTDNGISDQFQSPVKSTDRDGKTVRSKSNNQINILQYIPISDNDFKGFREPMKTDDKKIYLVDSGLSFNLPFPLTLRPQRGIELYITCDFSSRKSDSTPPFRVSII